MTTNRIPLIPSWSAIVPLLIDISRDGATAGGRMAARDELTRVAGIADAADQLAKAAARALDLLRTPGADVFHTAAVHDELAAALERMRQFNAKGGEQ